MHPSELTHHASMIAFASAGDHPARPAPLVAPARELNRASEPSSTQSVQPPPPGVEMSSTARQHRILHQIRAQKPESSGGTPAATYRPRKHDNPDHDIEQQGVQATQTRHLSYDTDTGERACAHF
jgi:hypothetical protein